MQEIDPKGHEFGTPKVVLVRSAGPAIFFSDLDESSSQDAYAKVCADDPEENLQKLHVENQTKHHDTNSVEAWTARQESTKDIFIESYFKVTPSSSNS